MSRPPNHHPILQYLSWLCIVYIFTFLDDLGYVRIESLWVGTSRVYRHVWLIVFVTFVLQVLRTFTEQECEGSMMRDFLEEGKNWHQHLIWLTNSLIFVDGLVIRPLGKPSGSATAILLPRVGWRKGFFLFEWYKTQRLLRLGWLGGWREIVWGQRKTYMVVLWDDFRDERSICKLMNLKTLICTFGGR